MTRSYSTSPALVGLAVSLGSLLFTSVRSQTTTTTPPDAAANATMVAIASFNIGPLMGLYVLAIAVPIVVIIAVAVAVLLVVRHRRKRSAQQAAATAFERMCDCEQPTTCKQHKPNTTYQGEMADVSLQRLA